MSPLPVPLPRPRALARVLVGALLFVASPRSVAVAGDPGASVAPVDVSSRARETEAIVEEKAREIAKRHGVRSESGRVVKDEAHAAATKEFLAWEERFRADRRRTSARDGYVDDVLRRARVSGTTDKGTAPGHPDYRGDDGDRDLQVKSKEDLDRIAKVLEDDGQRTAKGRNRVTAGNQKVMVWGPKEPVPLADLLDPEVFHDPDNPSVAQVAKKIAALAGRPLPSDPVERAALIQEIAKARIKAAKALGAAAGNVLPTGPDDDALSALKPGGDRRGRVVPLGATPEEETQAIERWRADRLAEIRKAILAEHEARQRTLADLQAKEADQARRASPELEATQKARRALESKMRADRLTLHMLAKQHPEAAGLLTLPPTVKPSVWREAARDLFGPRKAPASGADRVLSGCATVSAAVTGYTREVEDARREGREFSRWRAVAWSAAYNFRLTRFVVGVSDQLDANRAYVRDLVRQRAEEDPNGGWASDAILATKGFGSLAAGVSLEIAKAIPAAVGDAVFMATGMWGTIVSGVELADARADLARIRINNALNDTWTVERFVSGVGRDLLGDLRALAEEANALFREFERVRTAGRLLEDEIPRLQEAVGMTQEAVLVLGSGAYDDEPLGAGLGAEALVDEMRGITRDAGAIVAEADGVLDARRAGQIAAAALRAAGADLEGRFRAVEDRAQNVHIRLGRLEALATDRATVLSTHDEASKAIATFRGGGVVARDLVRRWTDTEAALARTRTQFDDVESFLRAKTERYLDPERTDARQKGRDDLVAILNAIPSIRSRLPGPPPVEGGRRDLTHLADVFDAMTRDLAVPPRPAASPGAESRAVAAREILGQTARPAAEMDAALLAARQALDRLQIVLDALGVLDPSPLPPAAPPPGSRHPEGYYDSLSWTSLVDSLETKSGEPRPGRVVLGWPYQPAVDARSPGEGAALPSGYRRILDEGRVEAWIDVDYDGRQGSDERTRPVRYRVWGVLELLASTENSYQYGKRIPSDGKSAGLFAYVDRLAKDWGDSRSLALGDYARAGTWTSGVLEESVAAVSAGQLIAWGSLRCFVEIGDATLVFVTSKKEPSLEGYAIHLSDPGALAARVPGWVQARERALLATLADAIVEPAALRDWSFSHYDWDLATFEFTPPGFSLDSSYPDRARPGTFTLNHTWVFRRGPPSGAPRERYQVELRGFWIDREETWLSRRDQIAEAYDRACYRFAPSDGTARSGPIELPGADDAWLWRRVSPSVSRKNGTTYGVEENLTFRRRNVIVKISGGGWNEPSPRIDAEAMARLVLQKMAASPPTLPSAAGR